jgi:uncharacterized phage protein gp47/JayE
VPFARPSLADLITRARADLGSRLSIAGALLRRKMADVLATVWAGAVHLLHGHLDWAARQLLPTTCDPDRVPIFASLVGLSLTPATFAIGDIVVTGVDGSDIPEGTIYRLDANTTYVVNVGGIIASGTVTITVQAELAGAAGNLAAGVELTLESPITGVDGTATVDTDGIGDGFDEETLEHLRGRVVLRWQEPPSGGSDQDYEAWALAVAGVTRVWVYRNENGLGTVVVRFVIDGRPDIFPSGGEVTAVQTALDAERPTTAEVTAAAPTALDVDFTIHLSPDTADLRTAVEAELTDLLRREAIPGDGAGLGTIKLSHIRTALGVAVGEGDYTLTVPAADVVPTTGQLAVMGTVTWV